MIVLFQGIHEPSVSLAVNEPTKGGLRNNLSFHFTQVVFIVFYGFRESSISSN